MPWAKIVAVIAIYAAGILTGAYIVHGIDEGKYQALKASYAEAQVAAIEKAVAKQHEADAATTKAVQARAESVERINASLQARLSEVERHENELLRGCVTYEFLRQLRSYIRDVPSDSVALPAGKSGRDCAPISGLRLGRVIIRELAIGRDNADAYNQLSAWARSIEAMRPQPQQQKEGVTWTKPQSKS